jgi:hypothetical protein
MHLSSTAADGTSAQVGTTSTGPCIALVLALALELTLPVPSQGIGARHMSLTLRSKCKAGIKSALSLHVDMYAVDICSTQSQAALCSSFELQGPAPQSSASASPRVPYKPVPT